MCGIVGARDDWLRARGRAPQAALRAAVTSMRWRGPDGEGSLQAGSWWLGCARLAISAGEGQPIHSRSHRTTVVMNGAITNARELWQQLAPGSEHLETLPNDAALPGLAVGLRRTELLDRLRGHHAYAVVDERTDQVYLGQDRYGERPLWCVVARTGGRWQLVAFSSTLAALCHLGLDVISGEGAIAQWFRYGWSEAQAYEIEDGLRVCELPGRGRSYVSRPAGSTWIVPARAAPPESGDRRDDVADNPGDARALPELLAESVQRCLDTPSTVGLSLSGGVDSSCLALTLGALGRVIPAYQFWARTAPADERRAAMAVAADAKLPLRLVDGGTELLDALPRLTQLAGAPLGDPSVLAAHAVAKAARADGVKVLLGGEGADELLLGYRRYQALQRVPRVPRVRGLARWMRRMRPWSMRTGARLARAASARTQSGRCSRSRRLRSGTRSCPERSPRLLVGRTLSPCLQWGLPSRRSVATTTS